MTVGALLGTEKRRFMLKLPRWIAWLFRTDTIVIEEDQDGVSSVEVLMWQAFYELEADMHKRK